MKLRFLEESLPPLPSFSFEFHPKFTSTPYTTAVSTHGAGTQSDEVDEGDEERLSVILAFLEESNNDYSPFGLTLCIHH